MSVVSLLFILFITFATVQGGGKVLKSLVVPDADYPSLQQTEYDKLVKHSSTSLIETITSPFLVGVLLFKTCNQFGINKIIGKSKDTDGDEVSELVQNGFLQLLRWTNSEGATVPAGYARFANDKAVETLEHFLRSNPFIASSLISDGSGYVIKSKDPSNRFSKILSFMDPTLDYVNAKFDSNMYLTKIWYEGKSRALQSTTDINLAAAKLCWNLLLVAEIIHVTLHIFNYMLTVGLVYGTLENDTLLKWAKTYVYNLDTSIAGVNDLLLHPIKGALVVAPSKSDYDPLINYIRNDLLVSWGKMKTVEDFLNWLITPTLQKKLKDGNFVTEFFEHSSYIKEYSSVLNDALKSIDPLEFSKAEERLHSFLSTIGTKKGDLCNISSIKAWIELMAVTGLLHGQTTSWTRFTFTNDYYRYINRNPIYNKDDATFIGLASVTNCLTQKDKYVFKNKNAFPASIRTAVEDYDTKTRARKRFYYDKLKYEPFFNQYGWIYGDFFPDNFDARSTSISYY